MLVKIKKTTDDITLPTRGTEEAAGYDLYSTNKYTLYIEPHDTIKIDLGIAIELPKRTYAMIVPRSGIAIKRGLRPANTPAIIDSDYRGNIILALHNDSEEIQKLEPHERIAQMIIMNYNTVDFSVVDKLSDTERGTSGLGSTGKF